MIIPPALLNIIRQFGKFGLVGLGGFTIDALMLHLAMHSLGLNPYAAAFFSFPFAVTFTWLGNRLFTFRGQGEHHTAHHQFMRFIIVCLGGLGLNRGAYSLAVYLSPFCYQYPIFALITGTAAGMFFNFFVARRLVFR